MYKKLLNKGFVPVYYTDDDWFESRKCESRLFYRYRVETKELLNSILNVLGIFDRYFFIIEAEDVVVEIEVDEELKEYWIYFYNAMTDNYDIPTDKLCDVFNVLPNKFEFEHSES
jgi:hypothetical protein